MAVEAALVTPVLVLLVFGILEFGMLFKDWLAVSNAVRAGVRIASAEPRIETFSTDAAASVAREGGALDMGKVTELWVYRAQSDGTPVGGGGGFASCTSCVKFRWDSGAQAFVKSSDTWPAATHNACQTDANRMNVGIYLRYDHPGATRMFFKRFEIADHAVMSFEPIPETRGCRP